MTEIALRFLIGGVVVSAFALASDFVRPKSFAGLLGASPSIALASVGLTLKQHGATYVALEGRSMLLGAAAFLGYAWVVGQVLARSRARAATGNALFTAVIALPVWFGVSFGLLLLFTRMRM